MSALKTNILNAGKWLFLIGISLLIIRNNSYPWPVKRASDILFVLSAVGSIAYLFISKEWRNFISDNKRIFTALGIIFAGLAVASINGQLRGVSFEREGILSVGRFIESALIVLLVGFFQRYDASFWKKAALAQLSTLVYIPMLLTPQNNPATLMGRFQLFENWPSNVGYYLVISLSLIIPFFLRNMLPFKKIFFIYYLAAIFLFGLLLWTQSRSSWLAISVISITALIMWNFRPSADGTQTAKNGARVKSISAGIASILLMGALGFAVLPGTIKNLVVLRFLPQLAGHTNYYESNPGNIIETALSDKIQVDLKDSGRIDLWKIYTKRYISNPLGDGTQYEPIIYDGSKKGPHNTFLELLIIGGPLVLIGFLMLSWMAFKNLFSQFKKSKDKYALWVIYGICSLSGLIIAAFFDNMSTFRAMWLIIGICIFMASPGEIFSQRDRQGA